MADGGFVKGASLSALVFTVGGTEIVVSAGEARARGVPFRLIHAHQGETLEALGETRCRRRANPGSRTSSISSSRYRRTNPCCRPASSTSARRSRSSTAPPLRLLMTPSRKLFGGNFAELSAADQRQFVDLMRQNKIEGWTGRPGALVYAVLRADAVDVVYGTIEGYEALGIPYMPHIPPEKRW